MRKKREIGVICARTCLIAGLLILWEILARKGMIQTFHTSYPSEIAKDLYEFARSGDLWRHMSITLGEAFLGLLYGTVIGVVAGVLLSQFDVLGKVLHPIIVAIYGIPQLAMAPVYILWFGIGWFPKIFLAALMVFFNVFFATYNALKNIDQRLLESGVLLGASRLQLLWHVVLPASMPWIISGIRMGAGICMIGAIVGEYMGASGGFGWAVTQAASFFEIKRVMSCIVVLLILGMILNFLLDKMEKSVLKWRVQTDLSMKNTNR